MRMFLAAMFIVAISGKQLYAQQVKPKNVILSPDLASAIFEDHNIKRYNIKYPFRRVYAYDHQPDACYLILCESIDDITNNDTLHKRIQAVNVQKGEKTWELNDFINSNDQSNGQETSIWFWTKFCEVEDLDGDGISEPLLVYGSSGDNGYDDGRIKIILYYKGQKIAVRHQNSTLDEGRNIQIDAAFYTLPQVIQQHIRKLMQTLSDKGFALYPHEYEKAMAQKKLLID